MVIASAFKSSVPNAVVMLSCVSREPHMTEIFTWKNCKADAIPQKVDTEVMVDGESDCH